MFSGILTLVNEVAGLFTITNIALLFGSSLLGIIVGVLPGLTATMGIAILTGITFGMPTYQALIILMGIYVGAIFGGAIPTVLLGIPGTAAASATVLDGHPLAKQGHGGLALTTVAIASFIGTLFGMFFLAGLTPLAVRMALLFTSPEFALLAIFGVTICGSLTGGGKGGTALKGWIAGLIGLLVSTVGFEVFYAFPRFSYGNINLMGGIAFVPAMIGLFGIPSVLNQLSILHQKNVLHFAKEKTSGSLKIVGKKMPMILRSGMIGVGTGVIPGVGEDVSAWISYDLAKKTSKEPEKFGKGSFEGLIAPETANSAAIGGSIIPTLSLGIPGSPPTAVLMGALMLHGIRPGPMISIENPTFIAHISAILLLAAFTMRFGALIACRFAPMMLKVPANILMPMVAVLSCIGAFALTINIFDLYVMLFFGLIGYAFDKMKYPAAPVVLGIILGPIVDENLRRTLVATGGSLEPFFTRPVALIILFAIALTILSQLGVIKKLKSAIFSRKAKTS
ncbi:MAG: tripartite tricarboxylate transporter permease [Treponema sp.]|nr:tripartite tricarboxylate transporter permease [Treponema sp.]